MNSTLTALLVGWIMDGDPKRHLTFPLRIAPSLKDRAKELADKDGISLNHFISLAIAEKVARMENTVAKERTESLPLRKVLP